MGPIWAVIARQSCWYYRVIRDDWLDSRRAAAMWEVSAEAAFRRPGAGKNSGFWRRRKQGSRGNRFPAVCVGYESALMSGHVERAELQSTLASQEFQVMCQALLDLQVAQHRRR